MNGLLDRTLGCMTLNSDEPIRYWPVVARFLADEAARQGMTATALAKLARRDRTVFSRMDKGAAPEDAALRAFEGALTLPRRFLTYLADGDVEAMERTRADADMVRDLTEQLATERARRTA